jgi:mannose-6-phosphate isomerase-like protein (cupin superfamily)
MRGVDVDRTAAIKQWGSDGMFFTEAARGGPLKWSIGGHGLDGDALGPVRHAHDDAAEYYYLFSGAANIEVGGHEFVVKEGELCLIPPNVPHNVLSPAADSGDVCLFCVVGPNLVTNKWRIRDFDPASEHLRALVGVPFADGEMPAGGSLSAVALVLGADQPPVEFTPRACESVYLVVDGALDIALHGGLQGTIEPGTYVHVREGLGHTISTRSTCSVVRMDCAYEMWAGIERPAE